MTTMTNDHGGSRGRRPLANLAGRSPSRPGPGEPASRARAPRRCTPRGRAAPAPRSPPAPASPVDDDRHGDDLGAGLASGLDGGQQRAAGRGGVLDGEHPAAGDVRALDPPLQAVRLPGLADHEGVELLAAAGRGVQHRGGDRVGAQRQAADGVEVQVCVRSSITPPTSGAARRSRVIRRRST